MGKRLEFILVDNRNESGSNLTELNATDALNNGFMSHNDWVGHGARYGYIAKWINKNKPKSVIDVGCGRFDMLNWFWRNREASAFSYVGMDLRANKNWFEKLGWKKGPVKLMRIDVTRHKELVTAPADLVVCTEVFEHVPRNKQAALLMKLFDMTKPGGCCIMSTPNAGVSKSTAANHIGPEGSRERTYKEKFDMATNAGFIIEQAYGVFIAKSRIPQEFWEDEKHQWIFDFLPNGMATVFAAAPYPSQSNNALFVMRRPK